MLRKTQYMSQEMFLAFNLLALFVITYILVDTFYGFINMRLNETGDSKVVALEDVNMPDQETLSPSGYEMIVQRNIFGAAEKEAAIVVEEKVVQVEMLQETSLALFLLGTIAGDKENARAIILDQRLRSQNIYRVGDKVQESVIRQILRGKVVLRHGEKDEVLSMDGAGDILNVAGNTEQPGRPYVPARARYQAASMEQTYRPYIPSRARYQARYQASSVERTSRPYIPGSTRYQAVSAKEETAQDAMETVAEEQEIVAAETETLEESVMPAEEIAAAPSNTGEELIPDEEKLAPNIPARGPMKRVQEPAGMPSVAQIPGFAAIEPFVASWAEALKNKNIEAYLSHYSKDFTTPGEMSRTAWEKQLYDSVERPEFIRVDIRDMHIQKKSDARVQAFFIQENQTETYSDKVLKTLDLVRENGDWLIARETSMPTAQHVVPAVTVTEAKEAAMPAAGSADLAAVEPFVASWAAAWKQQSVDAYLSHYSKNFITPGGTSRAAWEKQRHQRLGRPHYIKIEIREMQKLKVDESHVQVAFIQEYQSDIYSDKVLKTLKLIWEKGGWMIAKETSLAL